MEVNLNSQHASVYLPYIYGVGYIYTVADTSFGSQLTNN